MILFRKIPISGWTLFCYSIVALASLTGSLITLVGFLGSVVAFVSLLRNPPEELPKEGVWLSLIFAVYFAVLAITTTLNGPDPKRFIEFAIISPFIYFIPLALILPLRCMDISMKGLGRAAMIGTVPTAVLALFFSEFFTGERPALAAGNSNVLSALLLMQTFLCLAGLGETDLRERRIALICFAIGLVGLVLGVGSRGASIAAGVMLIASLLFWSYTKSRETRHVVQATIAVSLALAALTIILTFYNDFIGALLTVADPEFADWTSSDGIRLTLYRAAVPAIIDHPWIGLGQHMRFSGLMPYFASQPPDSPAFEFTHVHNLLLTHGTAAGIPGILAALSLFVGILIICLRRSQPSKQARWLGVMCALGLFVLGGTETVLFHDLNSTFYMLLFIFVAVFCHRARMDFKKVSKPNLLQLQ